MLPRVSQVACQEANYLLFSTGDVISNVLYQTGRWEEHLLAISKFMVAGVERPLVLDIGANLGAYSIPLAKHIQSVDGEVIGFEPQRIIYYQLCGNIVLNRLDNYHAVYSAVGDEPGEVDIPEIDYESNHNVGAFSLEKKFRELHNIEGSMKKTSRKVPLITLDQFHTDRPPCLIKIDVEGFELSVLQGGADFLRKHHYPPLLFEAWNFDWFKEGKAQLMAFVTQLGYEVTHFGTTDYVAQHPQNPGRVTFQVSAEGVINMSRLR
jgi:FkbM family methyltransferase